MMDKMKAELRKKFLKLRKDNTVGRLGLSQIVANLADLYRAKCCVDIFGYKAFSDEIDVSSSLEKSLPDKVFYYPRIFADYSMQFLCDIGQGWAENKYGILELDYTDQAVKCADASTFVVVPCLAVDMNGYRLGYGGGYYDRYMKRYPDACYVAIATDDSLVESLPHDKFDQRVGYIVTANQILEC